MRHRAMWLAPVLAGILTACAVDPSYPLLAAPGASQFSPTALGAPVRGVVLYLEIRPGDTVELVSAAALGVAPGADVTTYFSPPITSADGSTLIGQRLEPLEGATIAISPTSTPGPANEVAIVAEITARKPGRYSVTGIRVTFSLNGGSPETKEGITQYLTVCADDPAPATCDETPPP